MITKILKWQDGPAVRLSKNKLSDAQLEVGDRVHVRVDAGKIIVEKQQSRYRLEELVKQIPADFQPCEADWGQSVGGEEW